MSCYVRSMCKEDIAQVTEIDRAAFPSTWPPVNYQHELQNRLAHYIVACSDEEIVAEPEVEKTPKTGFSYLVSRVRQLFDGSRYFSNTLPPSGKEFALGFAGLWMMAEEAHLINLAVREPYRRQGIGELLLIFMIDLATELKAQAITLEVRASNIAAQVLYAKYGFTQVGLRRGYYTDNREDGVIMSTENIFSAAFQARFEQSRQAHSRKWGIDLRQIAR